MGLKCSTPGAEESRETREVEASEAREVRAVADKKEAKEGRSQIISSIRSYIYFYPAYLYL